MLCFTYLDTPIGKMMAAATDEGLCLFDFQYRKSISSILKRIELHTDEKFEEHEHPLFPVLERQINEYFTGERKVFDIQLHLAGTPFQKKVWEGLLQIPYGQTRSYEQQSVFLGDAKAIRAVAGANGENGIAIIVPCHRVIGKNGSLTGYGGGLQKKKWLLEHERKHSGLAGQINLF
jgi:AraC family transcriptional regulator of adaptative response/methylated-DNA-[protein]-cysteine methyltransferase